MHGKTFLGIMAITALSLLLSFSLLGCGKQKQPQGKGNTQTPQLSKESPATDTSDVFKEFYSEDTAKKQAKAGSKKAGKQETISPASTSSSFTPEFDPSGRYTVQISCVKSQSFANAMTSKMKDKGYPAYVAEVQNPTPNLSGTFYRVRIGGFGALSAAKAFGENILKPNSYDYWVDKKSNDNVGMEGYGLGSGSAGTSAAKSYESAPAATSTYQAQPSSGSTGSSYESTPSSSSYGSTPSSGTTSPASSSPYESSPSPSTAPSSGTSSSSSTSSDYGSSSSSGSGATTTGTTASSPSTTPASGTGSTGAATGTGTTGSSAGKDTASGGGW
jgi:hypothetical protein